MYPYINTYKKYNTASISKAYYAMEVYKIYVIYFFNIIVAPSRVGRLFIHCSNGCEISSRESGSH